MTLVGVRDPMKALNGWAVHREVLGWEKDDHL